MQYKPKLMNAYRNEWKMKTTDRNEANATQERLGDIFSSSLVRHVLSSAGWSLRWGPLEIIMTACCLRQPRFSEKLFKNCLSTPHPKCRLKIILRFRGAAQKQRYRVKKARLLVLFLTLSFINTTSTHVTSREKEKGKPKNVYSRRKYETINHKL